jgi:hypothetical protein
MPLLEFVRAVARARQAHEVLRRGAYRTLAAEGAALAYARYLPTGVDDSLADVAVVLLNSSAEQARLSLPDGAPAGRDLTAVTLPGTPEPHVERNRAGGGLQVHLAARSGALLLPRSAVEAARLRV